MSSYQYRDSHNQDNGNPHNWKDFIYIEMDQDSWRYDER